MSVLDKILSRENRGPVPVPTPEWPDLDGQLSVRRLSPADRIAFDVACAAQSVPSGSGFITFVAAYCTVTADGTRAFEDADWRALSDDPGSGSVVERLFDEADAINVLSSSARERLKKNSVSARDSSPSSQSRGTSEPA